MPYIGAGIQRFNTADSLTVNGDAEVTGTVNPSGDTASGDAAAVGFTSTEGLILTGQGSTSDITVKNDADATVFTVPTGTDDILFPDNAKAIFGAGSDLRLYHDGSNSYVEDAGSGYLVLKGSDPGIALQNSSAANLLLTGTNDVSLLFSGNAKLATTNTGVDITGTAVTDGLTSECAAGDSNLALTAYHPTSTSARTIAKFQSNVGSTQADKVTIGCDGKVTIADGDLVIGTSGHGIDFSATSDATGNSSELLDDYEEGTFTPDIRIGGSASGIGHSSQVAQYTKIGRMVTLSGRVALSSKGSGSGAVTIGGMPFASQNTSNLEFIGSVQFDNLSGSTTDNLTTLTNHNIICRISPNVLTIEMRRTLIGANDVTNVQISDTAVIVFTITYFT